jgi:hypothetical protein
MAALEKPEESEPSTDTVQSTENEDDIEDGYIVQAPIEQKKNANDGLSPSSVMDRLRIDPSALKLTGLWPGSGRGYDQNEIVSTRWMGKR